MNVGESHTFPGDEQSSAKQRKRAPTSSPLGKRVVGELKEGVDITHSETFTKGGKMVEKAVSTKRLFLGNLTDPRYSLAVTDLEAAQEQFDSPSSRLAKAHDLVKLTIIDSNQAEKTVIVTVKELSQRLHLSSRQIRQEAEANNLETFLATHAEGFSKLPAIVKEYNRIFGQYEERQGELFWIQSLQPAMLTRKQLMKIVRAAFLNVDQSPFTPSSPQRMSPKATILLRSREPSGLPESLRVAVEADRTVTARTFVAVRGPNETLTIVQDPETGQKVASGGSGTILRINNVCEPYFSNVAKIVIPTLAPVFRKAAEEDITTGAVRLRQIHSTLASMGQTGDGIQSAPSAIFNLRNAKDEPLLVGWIGKGYFGDIPELLNALKQGKVTLALDPKIRSMSISRVIRGLSLLHMLGRPHRDLKSENILVSLEPNTWYLDIGDLDTCKSKEEIDFFSGEFVQGMSGQFTPQLRPEGDILHQIKLATKCKKLETELKATKGARQRSALEAELRQTKEELFQSYYASDRFALAATIHEWLTGVLPYALQSTQYPELQKDTFHLDVDPLLKSGYPAPFIQGLIPFLETMLHPDWTKRNVDLTEFSNAFYYLIVNSFPN